MDETEREIRALIREGEHLALEFKSDQGSLPDRELIAAVVALANKLARIAWAVVRRGETYNANMVAAT